MPTHVTSVPLDLGNSGYWESKVSVRSWHRAPLAVSRRRLPPAGAVSNLRANHLPATCHRPWRPFAPSPSLRCRLALARVEIQSADALRISGMLWLAAARQIIWPGPNNSHGYAPRPYRLRKILRNCSDLEFDARRHSACSFRRHARTPK